MDNKLTPEQRERLRDSFAGNERPSFTPLDRKMLHAIANAAGIPMGKCLGFELNFDHAGLLVAEVKYLIDEKTVPLVLAALAAIPVAKPL